MATSLKSAIIVMAFPSSSPSLSSSIRSAKNRCSAIKGRRGSATKPNLTYDPNDSIMEMLEKRSKKDPNKLSMVDWLDTYDSPLMTSAPATEVEEVHRYIPPETESEPPDFPSLFLHNRVVFLGLPLVPIVTELIVSQLIYLQLTDPYSPVQLYVHSTGTTNDTGDRVGSESEGFAVYDALRMLRCNITTLTLGCAIGMACLLVASGTKGRRFMLPHAHLSLKEPRLPPSGLISASDVQIRAKEAISNRDMLIELYAKHTEKSKEYVAEKMRDHYFMGPIEAKEFGVIDKVLWKGQENLMKVTLPPSEWTNFDKKEKKTKK